jgi:hypothetical protein
MVLLVFLVRGKRLPKDRADYSCMKTRLLCSPCTLRTYNAVQCTVLLCVDTTDSAGTAQLSQFHQHTNAYSPLG